MATQTRPFMMTGAVLATAASIVAASPAIAPSVASTTTKALSSANVQLTTFSDIFTIPVSEWTLAAFQGYGGLIGSLDGVNPNPYAPGCAFNCYAFGLPGLVYLAGDALINGNGQGWDTAGGVKNPDYDPEKPIGPDNQEYLVQPWGVSAINYAYEGGQYYGISPFLQYVAQNSIGSSSPILSTLISLAFAGPALVTQVWNTAWSVTAALLSKLPLVGTFAANGIYAYLGTLYNAATQTYYPSGLSGTLEYVIDQITGGYTPPVVGSGASTLAARSAASTAVTPALSLAAPSATTSTPKPATSVRSALAGLKNATHPKTEVETDSTSSESTETKPDTTPDVDVKPDTTKPDTTKPDTTKPDTTPADTKPADNASSVADAAVANTPAATKPADAPGKANRKHPVRDAVQKAGKQIANAVASAKAAKADKAAN